MVTERREESPQQDLQGGDGGLPEFNIQDSTQPEQLEIEAELDAELGQAPEAQEQVVEEQPTEQVEAGAEQGAQPESVPGATEEPPTQVEEPEQQPPARTFSQEEVSKMQAAKDQELARERAELQRLREVEAARQVEANTETVLRQQEEQLAASVGEAEARRLVRTTQNIGEIKRGQEAIQRAESLQQQNTEIQQRAQEGERVAVAQILIQRYGIQEPDYAWLMSMPNATAMEGLAKRLSTQTLQQRKQTQEQRQAVPAETRDTQLTNGHSDGAASETPEQTLARISAKPGYEWTEDEMKFMRDGPPNGWS